jgi:hypothetical protein
MIRARRSATEQNLQRRVVAVRMQPEIALRLAGDPLDPNAGWHRGQA